MTNERPRTISEGPRFRDVIREMKNETTKSLKIPREILSGVLEGVLLGIGVTHFLPSLNRYSEQEDKLKDQKTFTEKIARGLPRFLLSMPVTFGIVYEYVSLIREKGELSLLTVPLFTNLLSITYESYRRNREKLIEKFPRFPGIT